MKAAETGPAAPFRHTPYDGSKKPFTIGLEPVATEHWFDPDGNLARHLARKAELIASRRDVVFRAEPGTEAAQEETLRLLASHLPATHPDLYGLTGPGLSVTGSTVTVALEADEPALLRASRLVQDDLVLMRKGADGYRIAAASLCFPSSWSLAEKVSRPMSVIHENVPGYAGRMGQTVDRIFDNLRDGQIIGRYNWSIYDDDDLHHPEAKQLTPQVGTVDGSLLAALFVRVERQTLRRLPASGDILFTIKIHQDPLMLLATHPEGRQLAAGLAAQLRAMEPAQLAYKGLTGHRDRLASDLESLAAS
ncbi:DUF3445 domain-containing protein [Microvirga tunisiensis]|uniref:DUF3445 domain-containing protein n=2 Tax=Pannonibacter tanglangensis TaxID=2750084 RepID=A0A7X5F4S0_9HYPH|nr:MULTISPECIES: DUF3445 domain-containing protein [unclassified Pannonibacter]NBN65287.1 DUF3445 domain-containing protein [Pannonibacter sp. XCT-34]NBN79736.1 DUF3445 domain-containing protein [Pannonibacter sp. XCT-53]